MFRKSWKIYENVIFMIFRFCLLVEGAYYNAAYVYKAGTCKNLKSVSSVSIGMSWFHGSIVFVPIGISWQYAAQLSHCDAWWRSIVQLTSLSWSHDAINLIKFTSNSRRVLQICQMFGVVSNYFFNPFSIMYRTAACPFFVVVPYASAPTMSTTSVSSTRSALGGNRWTDLASCHMFRGTCITHRQHFFSVFGHTVTACHCHHNPQAQEVSNCFGLAMHEVFLK